MHMAHYIVRKLAETSEVGEIHLIVCRDFNIHHLMCGGTANHLWNLFYAGTLEFAA